MKLQALFAVLIISVGWAAHFVNRIQNGGNNLVEKALTAKPKSVQTYLRGAKVHTGRLRRKHGKILLLDLDGTIYCNAKTMIPYRITYHSSKFLSDRLNVTHGEAIDVNRHLYNTYGMTVKGLLTEYPDICTAHEYERAVDGKLDVHDVLEPDSSLAHMLSQIKAKRFIFTNASHEHAMRVVRILGIENQIDGIVFGHYPHTEKAVYDESLPTILPQNPDFRPATRTNPSKSSVNVDAKSDVETNVENTAADMLVFKPDLRAMGKALYVATHPELAESKSPSASHPQIVRRESDGDYEHIVMQADDSHLNESTMLRMAREHDVYFVDDNRMFVEAGMRLGWKCVHVDHTGVQAPITVGKQTAQKVKELLELPTVVPELFSGDI